MNKKTSFITSAPDKPRWDSGHAGDAGKLALEVFGEEMPGPWLACYMLRRFGWPNQGSDDYKNLMSWCLTTPIKGLYLGVTPYLGGWPERRTAHQIELSFGVRFTKAVGVKLECDIGRARFIRRLDAGTLRWWRQEGGKLYTLGTTKKDDPDETLVYAYGPDKKGRIFGLYKRRPEHKDSGDNLSRGLLWWMRQFRTNKLGHVLPKMNRAELQVRGNPFKRKCDRALKSTILDLLRPTNVRDIDFNCFGRMEKSCATKPKPEIQRAPEGYRPWWPGAGNTPAYWYSEAAKSDRRKLNAKTNP
jgi:hypothetical protein